MARNGSGTFSVINSFTPSTVISSSSVNANFTDIGTEMTNSVAADGQTTMTAPLKHSDGTAALPSMTFGSDLNTGIYRKAADSLGAATAGVERAYIDSAGKLFALGAVDIAGALNLQNTLAIASTIEVGHASDTTLARASAGNLTVEGNAIYRAGGTDVPIADGGTGASTAAAARIALAALGATALQPFTASGTYTPTVGMKYCLVISTGAGGGGGGADSDGSSAAGAAGGGAGATCIELFDAATIGASQVVTIGAGGLAGADTGGNGGNGGNTTFGALHTAGGGIGGTGIAGTGNEHVVDGGAGGTATGGLFNVPGGDGNLGFAHGGGASITSAVSGQGGASLWGGGARGVGLPSSGTTVAGVTATVPGAGGSGAANINTLVGVAGGVGANGSCLVLEFTT